MINIHNDQVFDVPDNDDEYSEENLVNKSMNDLVALVLKFRREMVKAEDKIAHMEILIAQKDKNYSELAVVRQDLIVSKNAEVKYMAAGDKAALERKKVTEGTAAEIIEGLKQFLSNKLSPLQTILASVESIKTTSSVLPNINTEVINMSTNVLPNLNNSMDGVTDSLGEVYSSLSKFGVDKSENGVNIPNILSSIESILKSTLNEHSEVAPSPIQHEGPCSYHELKDQPNILKCSLGCNATFQAAQPSSQVASLDFSVPPPLNQPYNPSVLGGKSAYDPLKGGLSQNFKPQNKYKSRQSLPTSQSSTKLQQSQLRTQQPFKQAQYQGFQSHQFQSQQQSNQRQLLQQQQPVSQLQQQPQQLNNMVVLSADQAKVLQKLQSVLGAQPQLP